MAMRFRYHIKSIFLSFVPMIAVGWTPAPADETTGDDWVKDDRFRFAQTAVLKKFLDGLKTPYVLLVDFNDVPESRKLKLLRRGTVEAAKPADDHFTFSSADPSIEIDYIFVAPRSRWTIGKVTVVDEPVASDHRPVAELSPK